LSDLKSWRGYIKEKEMGKRIAKHLSKPWRLNIAGVLWTPRPYIHDTKGPIGVGRSTLLTVTGRAEGPKHIKRKGASALSVSSKKDSKVKRPRKIKKVIRGKRKLVD